jgi:hypothetical protein
VGPHRETLVSHIIDHRVCFLSFLVSVNIESRAIICRVVGEGDIDPLALREGWRYQVVEWQELPGFTSAVSSYLYRARPESCPVRGRCTRMGTLGFLDSVLF